MNRTRSRYHFRDRIEIAFKKRLKKLFLTLFMIIGVFIMGVLGYMVIEGWSFSRSVFMTAITISTVGYELPQELSTAGLVFTLFLIVAGVSVVLYGFTNLTAFIVEGEMKEYFERRRRMKKISSIRDHSVIIGAGRIGRYVIRELMENRKPFVIVEKDESTIFELQNEFDVDMNYIIGDATSEDTLVMANIPMADSLITTLPDDSQNVFTILTARTMNPTIKIISIINDSRNTSKLLYAGADSVISPYEIVGTRIAAMLLRPSIVSFLDVINRTGGKMLRIDAVPVPSNSPIVGLTLEKTQIPQKTGLIVIAMRKRGELIFNPKSDTKIDGGDELIVLGEVEKLENLAKLVKGETLNDGGK